jgi:CDGSH-type Zn-finger protein
MAPGRGIWCKRFHTGGMRHTGSLWRMADPPIIRATKNGPYLVKGPLTVVDPLGNEVSIDLDKTVALCRCGGSTTKPFCDGTHSKIGFRAAQRAVRQEEGQV